MGKYCYVASDRRRARRLGAHGGGTGRGNVVSPRAQLVDCVFRLVTCVKANHGLLATNTNGTQLQI